MYEIVSVKFNWRYVGGVYRNFVGALQAATFNQFQ